MEENRIHLLPEIVANQIAAGEVVDNPSSAIKEMMENAIDAGATSVTVNFRNAGLDLIQVVDNGCGMSPIDARMAFDRHATSKIRDFDDVYRLQTFGFRGEALASIAAVAQVELRTRKEGDEVGTITIVNGGEFISQTPTMCPVGSQFMVRNLFYTAPARRKFSSDRAKMVTEIKKVFRQVALCNPSVKCELLSNDMPILSLPSSSLSERIINIVGRHIKTNLLEVAVDTTLVKIAGYVGRPAAAKQKNNEQYLFVNGRYFRSPQIYRSIMKAYEKLIPDNCSPSYFLYLTVEPDRVDVNVSPHKTEVRFADAEDLHQIITSAVRSTLAKSGSVAMMDFDNKMSVEIPVLNPNAVVYEPRSASASAYNPFDEGYASAEADPNMEIDMSMYDVPYVDDGVASSVKDIGGQTQARPARSGSSLKDMPWSSISFIDEKPSVEEFSTDMGEVYNDVPSTIAGQESLLEFVPSAIGQECELLPLNEPLSLGDILLVGGGYAIASCGGRLMIVDLRRAKERILYDGYLSSMGQGRSASQKLLFPEDMVLSADDYSVLEEHMVEFVALGFEVELCGEGHLRLCGVPSNMVSQEPDRLIYKLLRQIEESEDVAERMREDLALVMAAEGARTVGGAIGKQEAEALLKMLFDSENYSFSPSGKPIVGELTLAELKSKLS